MWRTISERKATATELREYLAAGQPHKPLDFRLKDGHTNALRLKVVVQRHSRTKETRTINSVAAPWLLADIFSL